MQHISKQQLTRINYEQLFAFKVSELVKKRKKLRINQNEMATITSCSLRKIQLFENYKCFDAFLIYAYKTHFNKYE